MKYSPNLKFNILVSESCGLAQSLPYRLPCGFQAQIKSAGAEELRALALERPVDGLIFSSDELNIALEAAEHSYTAVLVVAKGDTSALNETCARSGVMVCTTESLSVVLPCFLACCARLRALCTETVTLKRKLDDTRIVSADDLKTAIYEYEVGEVVEVIIYSRGQQYRMELTLGEDVPNYG